MPVFDRIKSGERSFGNTGKEKGYMKKGFVRVISLFMLVTVVIGLSACNPGSSAKAETSAAAQAVDEGSTAPAQTAQEESTEAEQSAEGKRVYFAAPLFSEAERAYNLKIVSILEKHGYEVFLPQRDGFLAPELEGKTEEEKTTMIFQKDKDEVLKADILFMLLDGRVPDEGACVELGIAYASGKRCYGIKNDARSVELDMDLNPMISGCFTKLFYNLNEEELIKSLEEYLTDNEL